MRKLTLTLIVLALTGWFNEAAEANTLHRRIIGLSAGRIEPGGDLKDLTESLDDIYTFGVFAAIPFNDYVALIGNIGRTEITGDFRESGFALDLETTIMAYSGGVRFSVMPREVFNPFVSASYSYSTIDVKIKANGESMSDDFNEKAIVLAGGAEIALGDRFSVIGAFARVMPQDQDEDDLEIFTSDDRDVISVALNFWLTDNVLLGGTFAQELEDDSQTYQIAVGFSF